jgi:hypothetical protein
MEADRIGEVNGGANGTRGLFGTNTHHRRKKGKRRKDDMFVENKVKKAKVEPTKFSFENLPNLKLKFVTQSAKKAPSALSSPVPNPLLAKTTFASAEMQSPTRLKLKLSQPGHSKETWSSSVNGTHLKIKMNGQHKDKPRPESSEPAKNGSGGRASDKKKTARRGQTQFKKATDLVRPSQKGSSSRSPTAHVRFVFQDLFCGTRSLFVQVNDDLDECLYCGDERLVRKFLSPQGLSLQDVKEFLATGKVMRCESLRNSISRLLLFTCCSHGSEERKLCQREGPQGERKVAHRRPLRRRRLRAERQGYKGGQQRKAQEDSAKAS